MTEPSSGKIDRDQETGIKHQSLFSEQMEHEVCFLIIEQQNPEEIKRIWHTLNNGAQQRHQTRPRHFCLDKT